MSAATCPKLEDLFDNGDEFEDVLEAAEDEARPGREEEFVAEVRKKWETFGLRAYLSQAQADWLKRIAKV